MFLPLDRARAEIAQKLAAAIRSVAGDSRMPEMIAWLSRCRDILARSSSITQKFTELYSMIEGRRLVGLAFESALSGAKSYRDLPLSMRLALPTTLLAAPFVGMQGAGVAAFGSAIGLPAIVLIFLGAAGVTSVIEALTKGRPASAYLSSVADFLARDDVMSTIRDAMARGEQAPPQEPTRIPMAAEAETIVAGLLAMDPFVFEAHVMSFFRDAGMIAFVTRRTGDKGIDGVARHPSGTIVVQCKRYARENSVIRPEVQQFWGAVEQHRAWRGVFVTTSRFTDGAQETSMIAGGKLLLVDLVQLVDWHISGLSLSS